MLITISGIDGSGKSTLSTKLETDLVKRGYKVIQIEFPISLVWLKIQEMQKFGHFFKKYGSSNEKIGFALNFERFIFIQNTVIPYCRLYDYVILQRYFIDFCAIGLVQNSSDSEIFLLQDMYDQVGITSHNYYIDVSHEEAYKRIMTRGVPNDIREEISFHKKMADAYQECIERNYFDCIKIDGMESTSELSKKIIENEII